MTRPTEQEMDIFTEQSEMMQQITEACLKFHQISYKMEDLARRKAAAFEIADKADNLYRYLASLKDKKPT